MKEGGDKGEKGSFLNTGDIFQERGGPSWGEGKGPGAILFSP